ncbi:cytochrome d ubiquinol oxidase subunit II [Myxococcota bacterium]|nr:cytochrome d ubiquinol oxidase subunit II [Myxococcota bacterium]
MPEPVMALAAVITAALILYALTGGADYGGGVIDLFARGPRAKDLRALIARAIGPIWEANHVWLILVVVLTFVCLPRAFSTIMTALHIPLTILLIGVVLRGSAFVFRAYDDPSDEVQRRWSLVFAVASVVSPWALGVTLGAIASGRLTLDAAGRVQTDFVSAWAAPFPAALGLLVVALFTLLAATYLTLETDDAELQDALRGQGLAAGLAAGVLAFVSLAAAESGAPQVWAGLTQSAWSAPFQLITGGAAITALAALYARRWSLARAAAAAQVVLVALGWALSQLPYAVPPSLTLADAAAPDALITLVLTILAGGAMFLIPAFVLLYRVFGKRLW